MLRPALQPSRCTVLAAGVLALAGCGGEAGLLPGVGTVPDPAVTLIGEIQGRDAGSSLAGTTVSVNGIVTGDFQNGDADATASLNGFFIQDRVADADAMTSDGVFVYEASNSFVDVSVGDAVSVEGEVTEFFGETQIRAFSVSVVGRGSVQPTELRFPLPAIDNDDGNVIADLERYEGMLVRIPQTLTVSDLFGLERFGEVWLAADGRQYAFTHRSAPDVAGYSAYLQQRASNTLILDDAVTSQYVVPVRYLFPLPATAADYSIRIGDTLEGLTGNIRFGRGSGRFGVQAYRLIASAAPRFEASKPRDEEPPEVGGGLTVASFNVLNFFTTIDNGQKICGPNGDQACRGADSAAEFERQRRKILNALDRMNADIVGVIELENNASRSMSSIVDGLNELAGNKSWSSIDTGSIGDDVIRVGFIYNAATIAPLGDFALLDSSVDPRFLDTRHRPVLLQTFRQRHGNGVLNVAVSHLKSKGSACTDIGDPDAGDGQGNCNGTRTAAAAAIADWLANDPTASGDPDVLLIGDMNAYPREDPLAALEDAGFVSLLGQTAYSFQFRGASGALDHALSSPSLLDQVVAATQWHINADEPPVLDYNLESGREIGLFDRSSAARSSDHDPLLIGLSLRANQAQQ